VRPTPFFKLDTEKYQNFMLKTTTSLTVQDFAPDSMDLREDIFGEIGTTAFHNLVGCLLTKPDSLVATILGYAKFVVVSKRLRAVLDR
jgi:hypothetical protein